ncbi:uncharacterized protein SCODWIG_02962 [Saccharomycodes ludwigii]|uniref:Uncharacterized protein n=2 Tax=Saccharomycodes ludwigii TaxID=36035 RepID=A0A376B9A2_9ASCO|nr:uncharacterized protein SCODWIG_02962 [Saccharomycodes ludwigii]
MKNVESIVYKDTTPPDFYSHIEFKEANGKDVTGELEIIKLPKFTYLVDNPMFLLDAGGVGVLSYSHHNIDEPALELAGPFKPAVDEESQHGDIK